MLEAEHWVYVLANASGDYYIGKAKNLSSRLDRHKTGVNRGYRDYDLVCFLPCDSEAEARWVERETCHDIRQGGFSTNYVWGYDKAGILCVPDAGEPLR